MIRRVALVLALCGLPAVAADSSREAIQAQYEKSAKDVSLKYLEGALSIRAPEFQGFALDGRKTNEAAQRRQMQQIFRNALAIKENIQVLSCKGNDGKHATCQVRDILEITALSRSTRRPVIMRVETESSDEWSKTDRGWKQISSRVRKQSVTTRNSQPSADGTASPTPAPK